MSSAKEKSATVAKIGIIGAGLTALLDLASLSNQDVIKFLQGLIPFASALIYECWGWLSALLTPRSAESIKVTWKIKKAIKATEKELKNPSLSAEFKEELQTKLEKYKMTLIDSYIKS